MANVAMVILLIIVIVAIGFVVYLQVFDSGGGTGGNQNTCVGVTVSKPTNVNATDAGNEKITVSWDVGSDADSVNIYIDTSANFTVSSSTFVSNEKAGKKTVTIGPYKPGTYYIKVAGIKGKCRSEGEPSAGKEIVIKPPKPRNVRIRLDLDAYGNPKCNKNFQGRIFYIVKTANGCVNADKKNGRADFATDGTQFTIVGETSTTIRLASDPSKYLGVTIVGGNNHACINDISTFKGEEYYTWSYNSSNGVLGLANGEAILIGQNGAYRNATNHLFGPYVISTTSELAQCFPPTDCKYNPVCTSITGFRSAELTTYVKWLIEDA